MWLSVVFSSWPGMSAGRTPAETLLFVDDHHILYRAGTERNQHHPVRCEANPVIPDDQPWEVAVAWTSVYRNSDTGKYQLWYQAYGGRDSLQPNCMSCYAESDDGIHFDRPALGLYSYGDRKATNIIMVGNGGRSLRYGNSVIVDPNDPNPERRYKMAYFDFATYDGVEQPGLNVAFSPDGIHWSRPEVPMPRSVISYGRLEEPIPFKGQPKTEWNIPLSMSDALDVFYDAPQGLFAIYGKMWIDGPAGNTRWKHAMGRITSKDFIHWSTPELVLAPDDADPPHVEFHTNPVFYHAGCYFSLAQLLDRGDGGGVIDIELMISRDGVKWQRPFRREFFLPRAGGKDFESGSIFTNATPVILDNEIRFYYGAYSMGATSANDDEQLSGIGMASIPRDRFAGIRPVARSAQATLAEPLEHVGQITLKPMDLSGVAGLTINADASEGTVRVELLTADGYRIEGFAKEDALPLAGDMLQHRVGWTARNLSDLKPGKYMIRIHLNKAEVFALTMLPY